MFEGLVQIREVPRRVIRSFLLNAIVSSRHDDTQNESHYECSKLTSEDSTEHRPEMVVERTQAVCQLERDQALKHMVTPE